MEPNNALVRFNSTDDLKAMLSKQEKAPEVVAKESFNRKDYMKKYNTKYREKHKKKLQKYNLEYKKTNKEKLKEERRKYIKKNNKKTVEANRKLKLKQRYGITETEYNLLYASQEARCAICGDYQEVLHIDHCHTTGEVRGLLCGNCNRGIGMFRDNLTLLKSAINYLKK